MQKLYWTYRPWFYNHGEWQYSPWMIIWQQFSDYEGLITLKDNLISDQNYTLVNPNWKKNLTRFLEYTFADWLEESKLRENIKLSSSYNSIKLFDSKEEAKIWIRERTDLEEISEGKFLVKEAEKDLDWSGIKDAEYLII